MAVCELGQGYDPNGTIVRLFVAASFFPGGTATAVMRVAADEGGDKPPMVAGARLAAT